MPQVEWNLAQIYKLTYDVKFAALTPAMQARVLAVKSDTQLKDPDVDTFVREVCSTAEKTYENQQQDKSEPKAQPDLK